MYLDGKVTCKHCFNVINWRYHEPDNMNYTSYLVVTYDRPMATRVYEKGNRNVLRVRCDKCDEVLEFHYEK